ncbi:hypothetical protein BJV82DRAFT_524881 [Fennellomyces sp. T-0311]|nr:hypothetical protein BJV82DRAFT_524881 [Fennellomyces sp. T-0311]
MKSIRLPLMNKKFDDQYTFELHGYLTLQDFQSTIDSINCNVSRSPPPGSKLVWFGVLWCLWLLIAVAVYSLRISLDAMYTLIAIPILMLLVTSVFLWRHRYIRCKFEQAVVDACGTINATENIRGINYRFSKNGTDITPTHQYSYFPKSIRALCSKPLYVIVIEFDDRYNALTSQQFPVQYHSEDFVSIPLYAGVDQPDSVYISEKAALEKELISDIPPTTYTNEKDNVIRYI